MACERRMREGHCVHFQCPYSDETEMGYECVEVQGGFCEVGLNCLEKCDHSFKEDQEETANAAFDLVYKGL